MKLLDERYIHHYPFYESMNLMEIERPFGTAQLLEKLSPDNAQAVLASPFFSEWANPANIRGGVNAVFWRTGQRVGVLGMNTPISRGPATERDFEVFSLLLPHVSRAVQIGDLLDLGAAQKQRAQGLMAAMDHAVLAVDGTGRIVAANRRAEAMLRDGTLIRATANRIEAVHEPASAALLGSIRAATDDEATLGQHSIGVPLARQPVPAVAYVMPLARRNAAEGWKPEATAAVIIRTGENVVPAAIAAIAELFALTPAQAKVAAEAAQGRSRKEIARRLSISDLTVKTHLSQIYEKTGAADQRALALLFERLKPPG